MRRPRARGSAGKPSKDATVSTAPRERTHRPHLTRRIIHKLETLQPLRVEHEAGPLWLAAGAKFTCSTRVAADLVLADQARPVDDAEVERLCRALDALDRQAA